jgi:regulator of nucleoside diphosphate kinase
MARKAESKSRPPIILRETDADRLSNLASQMEGGASQAANLLLDEIERAEVRPDHLVPDTTVGMLSIVEFVDEAHNQARRVTLVYPSDADIALGRVSILTPVGAGLIGLSPGQTIDWPDRDGQKRTLRILSVARGPIDPQN